jgi:predicted RNase H-like nuclease (RuvC/YqgF family)
MTKAELEQRVKELEEEVESLQNELDGEYEAYTELENENYELTWRLETGGSVVNMNDFKYRLKIDGLMTDELNEFIDNYMKFYNKEE